GRGRVGRGGRLDRAAVGEPDIADRGAPGVVLAAHRVAGVALDRAERVVRVHVLDDPDVVGEGDQVAGLGDAAPATGLVRPVADVGHVSHSLAVPAQRHTRVLRDVGGEVGAPRRTARGTDGCGAVAGDVRRVV